MKWPWLVRLYRGVTSCPSRWLVGVLLIVPSCCSPSLPLAEDNARSHPVPRARHMIFIDGTHCVSDLVVHELRKRGYAVWKMHSVDDLIPDVVGTVEDVPASPRSDAHVVTLELRRYKDQQLIAKSRVTLPAAVKWPTDSNISDLVESTISSKAFHDFSVSHPSGHAAGFSLSLDSSAPSCRK